MVLPVSRRVPRVPRYSGTRQGSLSPFAYGACTLYRRPFQIVRLGDRFVTPRDDCRRPTSGPATPSIQRRQAYAYRRFGLVPFRSPLLGESRLLSLPPGTEMVHFPGLATPSYVFRWRARGLPSRGCPIRRSSGRSLFAAHRSLSQLTTSFIAVLRQGIHRTPLVA
jgi:hypothetical protein